MRDTTPTPGAGLVPRNWRSSVDSKKPSYAFDRKRVYVTNPSVQTVQNGKVLQNVMIGTLASANGNSRLQRRNHKVPRTFLTLLFVAASFSMGGALPAQSALVCRPADAQTANMIRYMKELVAATVPADSESVGIRTSYKFPVVSISQVSLVQTERTCKSALQSFSAALPAGSVKPTALYVVAVGGVYVVWAPLNAGQVSEWTVHMVLDSKFVVLSKFAG